MSGVLTGHAEFRANQLELIAKEASADVARLQKTYDDAVVSYGSGYDAHRWGQVKLSKENLEQAEARHRGALVLLDRARRNLEDAAQQALLTKGDALAEQVSAYSFPDDFDAKFAQRIDAAARELVAVISEAQTLGTNAQKPLRDLMRVAERLGFRELFAGRQLEPSPDSVAAQFQRILLRALQGIDAHLVRSHLGIRL